MMIAERFRVDDKVAIVTGASRGIGAACARALAEAGADVVIGARSADSLATVAAHVEAAGRRAEAVAADLSDRESLARLIEAATSRFGRIDIVVNNVGGSFPKPFLETSEKSFEKSFSWNVTTAFNLTQLAAPEMLKTGDGSVINIASAAGRMASRGMAGYGTAKAAMIALTRNLAQDLAPRIRVNAIAPGAIATDALQMVLDDDGMRNAMIEGTPLRRIGDPDDIAAAALYFASPASGYVTGQVLAVDGGIQSPNLEMPMSDLE
jgi:7-alpha-hydroxysteroid dehydrogenase